MKPFLKHVARVALFAALGAGTFAQACSSSSSNASGPAACDTTPLSCDAGTTCWPNSCDCPSNVPKCDVTNCTPHLACLPSLPGKQAHDACNNTIGKPTCSDRQTCVEFQSGHGGCLTYCDDSQPNHGCTAPETCITVPAGQAQDSPSLRVCAVVGNGDGGTVDSGVEEPLDAGSRDAVSERPF